jgi:Zn-finger nucleic acid-binding protein
VSNLTCPSCGTQTHPVHWEDVDGLACEACHGHVLLPAAMKQFFARHELHGRFESISFSVRGAPQSARNLTCPGCGGRDFRVLKPGVEIDVCAGCKALFFDAHEAAIYLEKTRRKDPPGAGARRDWPPTGDLAVDLLLLLP